MPRNKLYLVAVDGSEWGERAANRAVRLAHETGASVHFISVIPWSGFQPISMEELMNRPLIKEEEESHAHETIVGPLMEKHADSGVALEMSLHWGSPVEKIHAAAKTEKAEMVFVGRRGRSRIADLLLGSVANGLAHSLGVPIVLVP